MKRQTTDWDNKYLQIISDKTLACRIYKLHSKFNSKKNNNTGKRFEQYFAKEDIRVANEHRKDAQHHELSGKSKLKAWWSITTHLLGWTKLKRRCHVPVKTRRDWNAVRCGEHTEQRGHFERTGSLIQCCWKYSSV